MVEKFTVDRWVFIKVGFVTALIFISGLLIGYTWDSSRNDFLEKEILSLSVESESFITSQMYIENNPNYCRIVESRIHQIATIVDDLGKDMASIESKMSFINTTHIDRRYFLYETRFWMLSEEYKTRCEKNLTTILFFYNNTNKKSYEQGLVLTTVKDEFDNNVLVFSFELSFPEPVLELIKEDFGVNTAPTLIINHKKYEGFVDKEELRQILTNTTNG